MKLLLDTHAFLWWVNDAPELSEAARATIANPNNKHLFRERCQRLGDGNQVQLG